MELREAIEELRKAGNVPWDKDELWNTSLKEREAIATVLNAVSDGTLIPADAVFQVREGYYVSAGSVDDICECLLTEALTIRSADDVRREVFKEALDLFESRPDAVKVIRAMIKGGDDE